MSPLPVEELRRIALLYRSLCVPLLLRMRRSESVERGQKGKKKKKAKSGPALPVTGTPDLSELVDTPSYHQDNINISFTWPQVSTRDQRITDIIRYKMACKQELKMMEGMEGVMVEQIQKTKSEWFVVVNNLLKDLLNQRSGFLGNIAASSTSLTITDTDQRPRKRRREEATSSSIKCYAEQRRCALHHQCRPRNKPNRILKYTKALFENSKGAFNILTHGFQPFREHNFIVMSSMVIWTL